jgi:hypothetical protein
VTAGHFLEAAVFAGADEQSRLKLATRDAKNVRHELILPQRFADDWN